MPSSPDLPAPTLADLRRHAVARSLFAPVPLAQAIGRLGFVQADPLRAPARAQDLILRHRVPGYRAGDLERAYPGLAVEEDGLVNHGFLPRPLLALMHPRPPHRPWDAGMQARAQAVLAFVRERGPTHPREVAQAFGHGAVTGAWGGQVQAGTLLLEGLHRRGLLRVARRESGIRVYEAVQHPPADDAPAARQARAEALVRLVLALYAPLPSRGLGHLVQLLNHGAPHLRQECRVALAHLRRTLPQVTLEGTTWLWPEDEHPADPVWRVGAQVRLLAPFDPVVWDRDRFARLWGWTYRFEAYTPAAQRRMGHYALPLLWRERVVGWANLRWDGRSLDCETGFATGQAPRGAAFAQALQAELARMRRFLGADEAQTRAG